MKLWARATVPVAAALVLVAQSSVLAKLPTVRVTVAGPGLATELALLDKRILVNVWTGTRDKERFLDFPRPFIAETVLAPPVTLPRYSVSFFALDPTTNQPRVFYRVRYVPDLSNHGGYVYLPRADESDGRLNRSTIIRPQDGNWARASTEWSEALNEHLPLRAAK